MSYQLRVFNLELNCKRVVGLNHTSSPTHAIFCQYHWRLELFHCVETIGPVIKNKKKNMQYVHMNSC